MRRPNFMLASSMAWLRLVICRTVIHGLYLESLERHPHSAEAVRGTPSRPAGHPGGPFAIPDPTHISDTLRGRAAARPVTVVPPLPHSGAGCGLRIPTALCAGGSPI